MTQGYILLFGLNANNFVDKLTTEFIEPSQYESFFAGQSLPTYDEIPC